MAPPRRRPTIKDLAAVVGVAPSTVSNAYNRPDQLSVDLRRRILTEADRLGFAGPDPVARGLRTRRTGCVAVLVGGPLDTAFADPVTALTVAGIADELAGAGLALTLVPSHLPDRDGGGGGQPAPVSLPAADGLVSLCDDALDPLLVLSARSSLPTVVVGAMPGRESGVDGRSPGPDSRLPNPDSPTRVSVDDTTAARSAVGHLLALGHLRLAVVADHPTHGRGTSPAPPSARTLARLQGYRIGVEAVGLAWDDVPLVEAGAGDDAARSAAGALLAASPRPTAVLATSDRLAVAVIAAARDVGITVPDALSVVGFDDTLPTPSSPALTTVRQPYRASGQAAARALLALLRDEPPPLPPRLLPKLVVRGTSGPVPREER